MNVENKTVLVTGANRGIGRALVDEALHRGAARVYAGTRQPLSHDDPRVVPLRLDVTDAAQIEAAAELVERLDVLVNNAGLSYADDLGDRSALEEHLAVNLFGTYAVTQAFVPLLVRSGGGIVNVVSLAAFAAVPVMPAYSLSKAAAFSMTQSLRAVLAQHGVHVHAVLAGPVDTDMSRDLDIPKASPESVARAIFDGVAEDEEEIFPDPMSATFAHGWRDGAIKAFERQNATLLELSGTDPSFTTTFTVDQSRAVVFDAINDVRSWWTGEISGASAEVGDEFTYRYEDLHRSRQRVAELVPGERIRWHVLESHLDHAEDTTEWTGTDITFDIAATDGGTEVRFTHVGLVPDRDCFESCSTAWTYYVNDNLRRFIASLQDQLDSRSA